MKNVLCLKVSIRIWCDKSFPAQKMFLCEKISKHICGVLLRNLMLTAYNNDGVIKLLWFNSGNYFKPKILWFNPRFLQVAFLEPNFLGIGVMKP